MEKGNLSKLPFFVIAVIRHKLQGTRHKQDSRLKNESHLSAEASAKGEESHKKERFIKHREVLF